MSHASTRSQRAAGGQGGKGKLAPAEVAKVATFTLEGCTSRGLGGGDDPLRRIPRRRAGVWGPGSTPAASTAV